MKNSRVELIGDTVIWRRHALGWLRAVLTSNRVVVVPLGRESPHGVTRWYVGDQANPVQTSRATFVHEAQLADLSELDGAYVATVLSVPGGVDKNLLRNALSSLATNHVQSSRFQSNGTSNIECTLTLTLTRV